MKKSNFLKVSCAIFSLFSVGATSSAHAVEEPSYEVVEQIGDVEIRLYGAVVQAKTTLADSGETSAGFRRLAGFIFGDNDQQQKISMTAPVQETLGKNESELAFTMPADYTLDSLPQPSDPSVALTLVPARTVAVVSFSGWATGTKIQRYQRELNAVMMAEKLEGRGEYMLNQYNPPWTPPFMRRNEIMLEINQIGSVGTLPPGHEFSGATTFSF